MSRRGNSPGWAAFDRRQQLERGLAPQIEKESYPSLPNILTPLKTCEKNNALPVKSFSSVVVPSRNFPTLTESKEGKMLIQVRSTSDKSCTKIVNRNSDVMALKKAKDPYMAGCSLIEDSMDVMDNNLEKATNSLKAMTFTRSHEENKEPCAPEVNSSSDNFPCNKRTSQNASLGGTTGMSNATSSLDNSISGTRKQFPSEHSSCRQMLFCDTADLELILGYLNSIPMEPEWEEDDDVYLSHRKDAKKMMRSASQKSKAATNAFLRGDHFASQQHALKAREDWLSAKRFNAKAAKEILSIRNSTCDIWKLDLHGLHASEAVEALQEHLLKVEALIPSRSSVSPNRVHANNSGIRSSFGSFSCLEMENFEKQPRPLRQRPTSLQVITGVGNHSQGQAALPTAVKSFLNEKRYHFDEPRPGVICVRPKFRHG